MRAWRDALADGLVSGSAASVASAAALAASGALENGSAAAPLNSVSHWLWGRSALRRDDPSWRYTVAGYAIHHAASVMWAVLYERFLGSDEPGPPARIVANAALASAVACAVDTTARPRRARPGFKMRLSRGPYLAVYAAFGAGLALATLARTRRA